MLPRYHILIGLIITGILYLTQTTTLSQSLIILLTSVLIDFDHYLYYILEEKNYSLKKAWRWYFIRLKKYRKLSNEEKDKHKNFLFIFHGIEPILILYFLSIYFPILIFISMGFLIHLITDLTVAHRDRIFNMKLFLCYSIWRHFKVKRLGVLGGF